MCEKGMKTLCTENSLCKGSEASTWYELYIFAYVFYMSFILFIDQLIFKLHPRSILLMSEVP